jgi:hypothetical protein
MGRTITIECGTPMQPRALPSVTRRSRPRALVAGIGHCSSTMFDAKTPADNITSRPNARLTSQLHPAGCT